MTGKKRKFAVRLIIQKQLEMERLKPGVEFRLVLDKVKMCCVDTHNE